MNRQLTQFCFHIFIFRFNVELAQHIWIDFKSFEDTRKRNFYLICHFHRSPNTNTYTHTHTYTWVTIFHANKTKIRCTQNRDIRRTNSYETNLNGHLKFVNTDRIEAGNQVNIKLWILHSILILSTSYRHFHCLPVFILSNKFSNWKFQTNRKLRKTHTHTHTK